MLHRRFGLAAIVGLCGVLTGCSGDSTSTPAGSSSGSSGGSSGSSGGTDAGSDAGSDAGGVDPAPGHAIMTATFTNPVNGYKGATTPYDGLEVDSKAEPTGKGIQFSTYTTNGVFPRRNLSIAISQTAPVQGMTYDVPTDLVKGDVIAYQELDVAIKLHTWTCPGKVTFNEVSGKLYRFTFDSTCSSNGDGGVTLTAKGVGKLP